MNERNGHRSGMGWRGWLAVGLIVSWSLSFTWAVWVVAAEREALTSRSHLHTHQIDDHEQRLRVIEARLQRIAADVQWIRRHLERNPGAGAAPSTAATGQEDER